MIFFKKKIPDFVKVFLWSYDVSQMDIKDDKNIIIKNVLDFGTKKATDWLKKTYSEKEIKEVIQNSVKSSWSKKSINFWSHIYGVFPKESRF
jgi:hypothetical protein